MAVAIAALIPRRTLPPIWEELRWPLDAVTSRHRDEPVARRRPGNGEPVLLIPGFLSGDASLRPLEGFLSAAGYASIRAGIGRNVDCSEASVSALEERLVAAADRHGGRVAIVGHSRGGLFARALAQRQPDAVRGVITLGSPWRDQLAVHPALWVQLVALSAACALGIKGLLGFACGAGGCCEQFRRELAAPPPPGVEYVAVYSRRDGVVDWRACIDARVRNIEVAASHCGMVSSAAAFAAVGAALADIT
jgi:triacylglycerol lipase